MLTRFPLELRSDFVAKIRRKLIKMTPSQALLFNYLNAIELDFAMGYELFTVDDNLIPFKDVEKFYCSAGADLLSELHALYYNHELSMDKAFFIELSKNIRAKTLEEACRLANLWKEEEKVLS